VLFRSSFFPPNYPTQDHSVQCRCVLTHEKLGQLALSPPFLRTVHFPHLSHAFLDSSRCPTILLIMDSDLSLQFFAPSPRRESTVDFGLFVFLKSVTPSFRSMRSFSRPPLTKSQTCWFFLFFRYDMLLRTAPFGQDCILRGLTFGMPLFGQPRLPGPSSQLMFNFLKLNLLIPCTPDARPF